MNEKINGSEIRTMLVEYMNLHGVLISVISKAMDVSYEMIRLFIKNNRELSQKNLQKLNGYLLVRA